MLFDTHAHLNDRQFDHDRSDVITRAREFGVSRILNIGYNRETIESCLKLTKTYDFIYAAVGWHPHDAKDMAPTDLAWLEEVAQDEKVVALGEMGLDYYRNHSPKEVQQHVFRQQIRLARHLRLPIVIHNREATADVLRILREEDAQDVGGVMHCFSGDWETAQQCLELGFYIGIGGPVTFKKSDFLRDVVRKLPQDRLLIETDCPYLAPEPRRGRRNETGYVRYVAERIAQILEMRLEEVAALTTENACRLFGLEMNTRK